VKPVKPTPKRTTLLNLVAAVLEKWRFCCRNKAVDHSHTFHDDSTAAGVGHLPYVRHSA
jgi:hypothetical protein